MVLASTATCSFIVYMNTKRCCRRLSWRESHWRSFRNLVMLVRHPPGRCPLDSLDAVLDILEVGVPNDAGILKPWAHQLSEEGVSCILGDFLSGCSGWSPASDELWRWLCWYESTMTCHGEEDTKVLFPGGQSLACLVFLCIVGRDMVAGWSSWILTWHGILLRWISYPSRETTSQVQPRGEYSVRKMMGVCRWPLKIGPKKIEGKMKFGA